MLEIAAPFEQMLPSLGAAAERARRDDDRQPLVLAEHAQRAATQIGTGRVAAVGGEHAVDHLHPAATDEHRAAATALAQVAGAVALREVQALDRELWLVLVLAVRRRPDLRLVARVHVQDAPLAGTAEGHLAAAVEHDDGRGVDHLGGVGHHDRDRVGPAVERDDAAVGRPRRRPPATCSSPVCRCRSPGRDATCRPAAPRRAAAPRPGSRGAGASAGWRGRRPLRDRRSASRRPRPRAHRRFRLPDRTLRSLRVPRARRRRPPEASRTQYRPHRTVSGATRPCDCGGR